MEWVRDEATWAHLLESTPAVLFVFVNWSKYAQGGLKRFEMAERIWLEQPSPDRLSFWACDASTVDTLPHAIENWIRNEDAQGKLRLVPAIFVGNGTIVWIHRGRAVALDMSMLHLGVNGFVEKSRRVLAAINGV